jgi:hypothetical protein
MFGLPDKKREGLVMPRSTSAEPPWCCTLMGVAWTRDPPPASAWQVRWQGAIALNRSFKLKTENTWQVWQVIPIVIPIRLPCSTFSPVLFSLRESFEKSCHTCHCAFLTA